MGPGYAELCRKPGSLLHWVVCGLKAGVTHLEHWGYVLSVSLRIRVFGSSCLKNCFLTKEIDCGHFPQHFLNPMSQKHKLISCIFTVLSTDLRERQLLDTSLWMQNSTVWWCVKSGTECTISYKDQEAQLWKLPAVEGVSGPVKATSCNEYSSSHWLFAGGLEAGRGGWLDYWLVFSVWCEWKGGGVGRGSGPGCGAFLELLLCLICKHWCWGIVCSHTYVPSYLCPSYHLGDSVWGLRNSYSKSQLC